MWLFTSKGFYSVVTTDRGGEYMVRSRVKVDLEALLPIIEPFGRGRVVLETPDADYRYRLVVDTDEWLRIAEVLSAEINYDNFKDRVGRHNPQRARTYGRVWFILNEELVAEDSKV